MEPEKKKDVVIGYETLFELLRREKERDTIQKLDSEFDSDLIEYLNKQVTIAEAEQSPAEKARMQKELENIRRIIRDLYDRREKKLLIHALDSSRSESGDPSLGGLLEREKKIVIKIYSTLSESRNKALKRLLEGQMPLELEEHTIASAASSSRPPARETKLVRFLHAVPKFLGKELEEYGPFEEEDVASLPSEICDILIKKGRAEIIENY